MTKTTGREASLQALLDENMSGCRLVEARHLEGGVAAEVLRVTYKTPDGKQEDFIVRSHGDNDLSWTPDLPQIEFELLKAISGTDVPAPLPLFVDMSQRQWDGPVLAVSFIEGALDLSPDDLAGAMKEYARKLAAINKCDPEVLDLKHMPSSRRHHERLEPIQYKKTQTLPNGENIAALLEKKYPPVPRNPAALVHGDFWAGNILWQGGEIVGVIDWEDALIGDPIEDLATARLEIFWLFGKEAAMHFTRAYFEEMPHLDLTDLALWDLIAALKPVGHFQAWFEDEAERQIRQTRHEEFMRQALTALS